MTVLFVVAHPGAAAAFTGLAGACARADVAYDCFFTGEGVRLLDDPAVEAAAQAAARAVVCEYSWARWTPGREPPVEQGSQTDHSAMVGEAGQVVSL